MNDQQTQSDDMPVTRTNGLAKAALVLGILSLGILSLGILSLCILPRGILSLGLVPLTGIPAIICGAMALERIRASGARTGGKNMAKIGLTMGISSWLLTPIVVFLYFLCSPARPHPTEMETQAIIKKERYYFRIGGLQLGRHLAAHHAGARVIVLEGPEIDTSTDRPNDGLKVGFGESISIIAIVEPVIPASVKKAFVAENPPPGMQDGVVFEGMLPPLEYWFTGKMLDEVLAPYKGKYDIVVTQIGLPKKGLKNSTVWTSGVKFAFANGDICERYQSIVDGTIVAAVTYNPKALYSDSPPPVDPDKAFDKRYLLLTPENVKQMRADYPEIFKK